MAVLATDNFNRADANPIGGNWTTINAAMKIASNVAAPVNDANDSGAYYNAVSFPNDQYSQAKIVSPTSGNQTGCGVYVRANATSGGNGYMLYLANNANGAVLYKLVNGTPTLIWQRAITYGAGNVGYLEVQGTTLIARYNGAAIGASATDSAHAAGSAGISYSSANAGSNADDWEGGDFAAAAATPFPPFRRRVVRLPGAA
jgi:hypothetical protein